MSPSGCHDTLLEQVGEPVTAEFGGRIIDGVIRDVEYSHAHRRFEPRVKLARGDATLSVAPEAIVD